VKSDLSEDEAEKRIQQVGYNEIRKNSGNPFDDFLLRCRSPKRGFSS
jgi:hypothetical protein